MRGKAPSKQFFHDGTKYIVTGNEEMADSHFHEIRAHLHQLKRVNVNKLPILSGAKEFDDGTIAIYSISYELETINIFTPTPIINPEKKDEIIRIEKVIPIIRSSDNMYWIACISGTFEPPYYCFENINEIPAESFDDLIETEIDNTKLSVGKYPLDDSIDFPELYFIAQTGQRDTSTVLEEYDNSLFIDTNYTLTEDPRYESNSITPVWYAYLNTVYGYFVYCPEDPGRPCVTYFDISYSYDDTFYRSVQYQGEELAIRPSKLGRAQGRSGVAGSKRYDGVYQGQGGVCDPALSNFPLYSVETGYDLESFYGDCPDTYDYSKLYIKGISIESEAIANFACCFCDLIVDQTNTPISEEPTCHKLATERYVPWSYEVTHKRTYIFQVGENEFPFYSPPNFIDGVDGYYYFTYEQTGINEEYSSNYSLRTKANMLKYYGPVSKGKNTGIMCGRVDYWEKDTDGEDVNESCITFLYNYIGPNSEDSIRTTEFIPNDPTNKPYSHIIANVRGLTDDVKFIGEIFLGKIIYNIKNK